MSDMGQTLPMDFAPLPPDVRCCSKSDHLRRECEMTLRAKNCRTHPQQKQLAFSPSGHREVGRRPADWGVLSFAIIWCA
jgi:hypothetical protein